MVRQSIASDSERDSFLCLPKDMSPCSCLSGHHYISLEHTLLDPLLTGDEIREGFVVSMFICTRDNDIFISPNIHLLMERIHLF